MGVKHDDAGCETRKSEIACLAVWENVVWRIRSNGATRAVPYIGESLESFALFKPDLLDTEV